MKVGAQVSQRVLKRLSAFSEAYWEKKEGREGVFGGGAGLRVHW